MLGQPVENEMQLLNFNDMEYKQDPVVSTTATREFRTHAARELEYKVIVDPNEAVEYKTLAEPIVYKQPKKQRTVMIDVPSGSRYVDAKRSYLAFTAQVEYPRVTEDAPPAGGGGSFYEVSLNSNPLPSESEPQIALPDKQGDLWTNLIKHSRWIHASKREIENVQHSDHESYLWTARQPSDWQHSVGSSYRRFGSPPTLQRAWDTTLGTVDRTTLGYDPLNTFELLQSPPGNTLAGTVTFADGGGAAPPDAFTVWSENDEIHFAGNIRFLVTGVISSTVITVARLNVNVFDSAPSVAEFSRVRVLRSNSETVDVVVPLSVIFPSWRQGDKLFPPQLVGGSTFEFELNPFQNAFLVGVFNPTRIPADQYKVLNSDADALLFGYAKYTITDFRVVLDEREMFSSISSLMWNVSAAAGTPLKATGTSVILDREPVPFAIDNDRRILENEGESTLYQNLSRIDSMSSSFVLLPSGNVFDFFIPKLRPPILGSGLDLYLPNEYRFKSGYRYWPDKEPTYSEGDGHIALDSFLKYVLYHKHTAMTFRQWLKYVGSFFTCFRRDPDDSTTGVAITHKRPMELRFALFWRSIQMGDIQTITKNYAIRHETEFCRYLNVYGNLLETRE
jgi:hypothetical protein